MTAGWGISIVRDSVWMFEWDVKRYVSGKFNGIVKLHKYKTTSAVMVF